MRGDIKKAKAADCDAIARLHVLSWRFAYRGILPDSYLDKDAILERRAAWQDFFNSPPQGATVFVSYGTDNSLDGFIALEQGHEEGYDAIIENLHVAPRAQGRGLGKKLLARAVEDLIGRGLHSVCLWVYDDNKLAIDFYQRLGGQADSYGFDSFAGADAPHTRIGWRDLTALGKRCL